ncbi:MAG TPA: hypothetical protein VFX23_12355 [Limnobacter sp.]|nr:hypothetical protein [Limnobacter sp.]
MESGNAMASSGPAYAGNPFPRVPISGWRFRPGRSNSPVRCAMCDVRCAMCDVRSVESFRLGMPRSAIQGLPAAKGSQLWNMPDLRLV